MDKSSLNEINELFGEMIEDITYIKRTLITKKLENQVDLSHKIV